MVADDALVATAEKAIGDAVTVRGRIGGDQEGWEDVHDWWSAGPADDPEVAVADDDPLRLMYTSGTESRPKGVLLPSRSLISQYVSCVIDGEMAADDVEAHSLPMYHCAQLDCFFSVDVYLGATSIILPAPEPAALLATIEREGVTKLFCPPTVWISLLRHADFETRDLSSLRKGYYGASPMPVEVLKELGRRLPDVQFWNFYGQTEMAPLATILRPHEQVSHAGSAGRASINVETMLVDDDGRPVPAGEVGEIVHRSTHATLGYYENEEKTAEAFAGGWFHSGDLGVMHVDGYVELRDRAKDVVISGGENISTIEVEQAVVSHPAVLEAAVIGVPDEQWGERPKAFVVLSEGESVTPDELIEHVKTKIARYKAPRDVEIVEALPKTSTGKVQKFELREKEWGERTSRVN